MGKMGMEVFASGIGRPSDSGKLRNFVFGKVGLVKMTIRSAVASLGAGRGAFGEDVDK
jgi:hypothetical protein